MERILSNSGPRKIVVLAAVVTFALGLPVRGAEATPDGTPGPEPNPTPTAAFMPAPTSAPAPLNDFTHLPYLARNYPAPRPTPKPTATPTAAPTPATTGGYSFPGLPHTYGEDVETWWSTHPLNKNTTAGYRLPGKDTEWVWF